MKTYVLKTIRRLQKEIQLDGLGYSFDLLCPEGSTVRLIYRLNRRNSSGPAVFEFHDSEGKLYSGLQISTRSDHRNRFGYLTTDSKGKGYVEVKAPADRFTVKLRRIGQKDGLYIDKDIALSVGSQERRVILGKTSKVEFVGEPDIRNSKNTSDLERTNEDPWFVFDKKLDYLLVKIDTFAEADDRNGAALHQGLATAGELTQNLSKTLSLDQAELRNWRRGMDARLEAIERWNADLSGGFSTVGEKANELGGLIQACSQMTDARLTAIELSNADLCGEVSAVGEKARELAETIKTHQQVADARLTAIEQRNADLAERLDMLTLRLGPNEAAHATTKSALDRVAKLTITEINKNVERITFNEFRQQEALQTLQQRLNGNLPLPATRGWAASPDFLLYLYQHIVIHRPTTVVELGSGVSTLVASAALAANRNGGRLHSIDHDRVHCGATSELIKEHGFQDIAVVHNASLAPWRPTKPTDLGAQWLWYSVPDVVDALESIDLIVVDGPPSVTGSFARYPAIPHFSASMAQNCTVLLDDARRRDEKMTAEAWSREYGLSLKLLLRADREFEKGLAILANHT